MSNLDFDEVLAAEVLSPSLTEAVTIREYLKKLLSTLWSEGESFSGKRPFGDSGWEYDIYASLVKCGAVSGVIDDCGDIEDIDISQAKQLVFDLINHVFDA